MSMFLFELGFYPQLLFSPADDDGGSGGGDDDQDDDDQDDNDDDQKDDDQDDDKDKKGLLDKDKITGKDKKKDDDGDQDKKDDRPEFIKEKFWDPEKGEPRLEAMAKAYDDLEKKLGNKDKAPDEYKIELNDDLKELFQEDKVDDDPLLNWFKEYAKENNFTQEMFTSALNGFAKSSADFLKGDGAPPAAPDPDEEKEKLGKNADAIIDNQIEFLSGMFKRGEINESQMDEIMILTETASGIQALQAIRAHYGEKQNIPLNLKTDGGVKSAEELRAMQADDKYGVDQEYTEMVDKEYEKKYGKGQSGQSQQSAL